MIDPTHGNWDFFADHPSDYARSSAVEAFLQIDANQGSAGYLYAARYVLLRAITHTGAQPDAMLSGVRDLVRDLPADAVAEVAGHDPGCDHSLRWAMTVLAAVREPLQWIRDHDRRMPKVSIARWLAGPASTLLFVRRDPDRPDHEIRAVIASLRDHAMLGRLDVEELQLPAQNAHVCASGMSDGDR